jgi:hypothetical protein
MVSVEIDGPPVIFSVPPEKIDGPPSFFLFHQKKLNLFFILMDITANRPPQQ